MSEVADVLNGAADLIERDGWCQDLYHDKNGCRCIAAAIDDAADDILGSSQAVEPAHLAREAVSGVIGGANWTIWNDTPGRTESEVVSALRTAADHA